MCKVLFRPKGNDASGDIVASSHKKRHLDGVPFFMLGKQHHSGVAVKVGSLTDMLSRGTKSKATLLMQ